MKILIIGGDSRQCEIGAEFISNGDEVYTYALGLPLKNSFAAIDLASAASLSDVILLPLPMTRDGIYINTPHHQGEKITIDEVLSFCPKTALLLCGKMPESVREKAKALRLSFSDYYEKETFLSENAYITAEGALFLAMQQLKTTVKDCPCMIIGGGRIAKNLLSVLLSLGARVRFCARSVYDLRWAKTLGATPLDLASDTDDIIEAVSESCVIFNTVPCITIPDCAYEQAKSDLIFIELAGSEELISRALKERDIYTVCAKSLPSKYAPSSAGKLLYDTIRELLKEKKGEKI